MNIEAIIEIGGFPLILGLVLLVPGLWWAKCKSRKIPEDALCAKRVTLFGFVFSSVFVGLILLVFNLEYIAPGVSGGQRSIAFAAILLVGALFEKITTKLGFKLVVSNKK